MRLGLWHVVLAVLLSLAPSTACKKGNGQAAQGKGALRIAVVPKGTTHEFWKSVHAGATKAGQEEKAEVVWKGPLKEDDLKQQIDVVDGFTAEHVSGLVLAPLSDKGLVAAVRHAKQAGVPTVVFDSDLAGSDHVAFVATDNDAAGKLAGEHLRAVLGGKGKVVLLRYQEGSASTAHRERGFLAGLAPDASLVVVSDNRYGGATTETAFTASENVLSASKAASGGVDGVFCPNESTTFGMLLALRKANLAGKIKLVGFDASAKMIEGLRAGHVSALVVQDPFNIGYLAVKTMARHLRGDKVEARVDTGSKLVTPENLDQPAIQALVAPPVF